VVAAAAISHGAGGTRGNDRCDRGSDHCRRL